MENRLLRLKAVQEQVGLRRTTIFELIKQGEFPQPRKLSARAIAWNAAEIDAWVKSRPAVGNAKR